MSENPVDKYKVRVGFRKFINTMDELKLRFIKAHAYTAVDQADIGKIVEDSYTQALQDVSVPYKDREAMFTTLAAFRELPEKAQMTLLNFWNEEREKWRQLSLELYREHIGDRTEGHWEELMQRAKEQLVEAGLLKE